MTRSSVVTTLVAVPLLAGCSLLAEDDRAQVDALLQEQEAPAASTGLETEPGSVHSTSTTNPLDQASTLAPPEVRQPTESQAAFARWLRDYAAATADEERGLYYAYYDVETETRELLSLAVSAQVLRFTLRLGDEALAERIGHALVRWQHDGAGKWGERLRGAFPSAIEPSEQGLVSSAYYDSADTLVVTDALLDLYAATQNRAYLAAASRAGDWIRDVMAEGRFYGLWKDSGGIMRLATASGDFDNRVPIGRTLLWLPTLHRLSQATGDQSYAELAKDTWAFLGSSQNDFGGFPDSYDPGYPAETFAPEQFVPWGIDGAVFADDSIRAAIGAYAAGADEEAWTFAEWIGQRSAYAGYLDLETGEPLFAPGDRVYYDVVASALYRSLGMRIGVDTTAAEQFLARTQANNGGWYWGWDVELDAPLTSEQSTMTGLWAAMDLVPTNTDATG